MISLVKSFLCYTNSPIARTYDGIIYHRVSIYREGSSLSGFLTWELIVKSLLHVNTNSISVVLTKQGPVVKIMTRTRGRSQDSRNVFLLLLYSALVAGAVIYPPH